MYKICIVMIYFMLRNKKIAYLPKKYSVQKNSNVNLAFSYKSKNIFSLTSFIKINFSKYSFWNWIICEVILPLMKNLCVHNVDILEMFLKDKALNKNHNAEKDDF